MVYIHSASAPAKNTKERVVGHMSCDATQGCAFETTFRVGGLDGQQTSHSTSQQEAFHWRFPIGYRHPPDRPECELRITAFVPLRQSKSPSLCAARRTPAGLGVLVVRHNHGFRTRAAHAIMSDARGDRYRGECRRPQTTGTSVVAATATAHKSMCGGRGSFWPRRKAAARPRLCAAPGSQSLVCGAGRSGLCARAWPACCTTRTAETRSATLAVSAGRPCRRADPDGAAGEDNPLTGRAMAAASGISLRSVQRYLGGEPAAAASGAIAFKLSQDPAFAAKLRDVARALSRPASPQFGAVGR